MKSKKNYCAVFHIGVPVKYVNFRFFLQTHHVYLGPSNRNTFRWRDVMEDEFYEKYSSVISDKVCISTNNECVIWTAATTGEKVKYGVVKVRFRCGNRRTVKAHRLSYMLYRRQTLMTAHLDASHLCHNSLCVNVEHVSLEAHSVNVHSRLPGIFSLVDNILLNTFSCASNFSTLRNGTLHIF